MENIINNKIITLLKTVSHEILWEFLKTKDSNMKYYIFHPNKETR
jgi:hypothetical protein